MRILFICSEYPPSSHGGIGTFVQTLAHELVLRGHEVFVIGYDKHVKHEVHEQDHGVSVTRIPLKTGPYLRLGCYSLSPDMLMSRFVLSKHVNQLVKQKQIDIVESYDWSGPLWFAPTCPLIVRLHGANTAHSYFEGKSPNRFLRYVEARNIRIADQLVAVSGHIRDITLKAFNVEARNCEVIYNSVDTGVFTPKPTSESDDPVVLFVGKAHPRKGIKELLEAWSIVHRIYPSAVLHVVGSKPNDLTGLFEGKDFDRESVQFSGFVPHRQLPEIYSSCTIAVFPSKAEAFGLTCAEAMACSCAVVMTSLASGPEIVEHDASGLLADPRSPSEFAQAILRLLADPNLRQRLRGAARIRVLDQFDKDQVVDQNIEMYSRVIAGRVKA